MKRLQITLLGLLLMMTSQAQDLNSFLDEADTFFQKHVKAGQVDYATLASDNQDLKSLVNRVAGLNTANLSQVERKAFFINAYNISVINGIIENYPTNSPLDINGFFDAKKHNISGENITLNKLEKDYLLKVTGDERLHFVLVCAAVSCPPLATFAYRPEKLEEQILERTQQALSNDEFIQVDVKNRTVKLSEIFRWYSGDFKGKADNIIAYLNKFRDSNIPTDYKTGYYMYNWSLNSQGTEEKMSKKDGEPTSNLQQFTPSVLLRKGQVELISFYNIYTQRRTRNAGGDRVNIEGRQSFFNVMYNLNVGVSKSARINVGFDVLVSSFSDGDSPISPIFQSGDNNEVVLAGFGPAIRFTPFKRLSNLSIRSALWFPGGQNLENRNGNFVAHDRISSFTQVFYDAELNANWRLFTEVDLLYRFSTREDQVNFFRTPVTGILSYFPNGKSSIFALYQYSPRYERLSNGFDEQFGLTQWFQQAGLGFKYQLSSRLELEASYTNFFASRNDGGGETFNIGFRWLR